MLLVVEHPLLLPLSCVLHMSVKRVLNFTCANVELVELGVDGLKSRDGMSGHGRWDLFV